MNQLDIDKDTKTEVIKNATTSPQASDQTDGNTMFAINEHDKMKIKLINRGTYHEFQNHTGYYSIS